MTRRTQIQILLVATLSLVLVNAAWAQNTITEITVENLSDPNGGDDICIGDDVRYKVHCNGGDMAVNVAWFARCIDCDPLPNWQTWQDTEQTDRKMVRVGNVAIKANV